MKELSDLQCQMLLSKAHAHGIKNLRVYPLSPRPEIKRVAFLIEDCSLFKKNAFEQEVRETLGDYSIQCYTESAVNADDRFDKAEKQRILAADAVVATINRDDVKSGAELPTDEVGRNRATKVARRLVF